MLKYKTFFRLLILLLGNIFITQAQTIISGVVRDSLGMAIPRINVFVKPLGQENVISYGYTSNKGTYTLIVKKQGAYVLNVSALSFEKKQVQFLIDSITPQKTIIIDVVLSEKEFELNEVIVRADRSIVVKRDTIILKVSDFINGSEEVIEDVLRKLPGIEVSDDGNIKVQGKSIEKVMVEGDDLFDKGYKLLTKNLTADVISRVEILEHFSDNPILKGIEDSDKVALNLTLKEDRKSNLFGNASLGYGTSQFYENKLNLISFNKKTKYYFFGNLNNIGNDPTGDIYQLIYPDLFGGATYVGDGESAYKFINLGADFIRINKNRTNLNNAELASLSGIYNPTKNLKLKGLAFFTSDETDLFRNSTQQYFFDETNFTNEETYKFRNKSISGFGKWDAIYNFKKDARIEYVGKYNFIDENGSSNLLFNTDNLNEDIQTNSTLIDQRITYTKKIKDKSALQITGRYILDEKPQRYDVDSFLYQELFPSESDINAVAQEIQSNTNFFGIEANYILNSKKSNTDFSFGYTRRKDELQSYLFFKKNNEIVLHDDLNYQNNLNFTVNDFFATISYKRRFKKFSFKTIIEGHQLYTTIKNGANNSKANPLYFIPSLNVEWNMNKKSSLSTRYKFVQKNYTMRSIFSGFILDGYRNFNRGIGDFDQMQGNLLLLNYRYGDWASKFLVNASLLYQKNNDYLSSNTFIRPNFNQSTAIILKDNEFFSFNISTDTFIDKLSSNLKLTSSVSKNEIQNSVNDSELRSINSLNFNYGWEFRTAFESMFNFHLGSKWMTSKVKTNIENSNTDNSTFLDLDFQISKKLKIHIKNEHYSFGSLQQNKSYFFSDINVEYDIKKNGLKLKFIANNILNTNSFANYYISDVSTSSFQYRLVPRYLLLKLAFRF